MRFNGNALVTLMLLTTGAISACNDKIPDDETTPPVVDDSKGELGNRHSEDTNANTNTNTKYGKVLTVAEVRTVLTEAGFKESELAKMSCIAFCESGFRADATHDNGAPDDGKRYDSGLFQINDSNLPGCGLNSKTILDPVANAKCARRVYLSQGYGAWAVYKPYCQNPPANPMNASCK